MVTAAAFLRSWLAEPQPPFELRQPSARWSLTKASPPLHRLRIAEIVQETPSTRTFVLEAADGGPCGLSYRAGQHLTLMVKIDGRAHRRCYSFSSSPASPGPAAITVKRMPNGIVSQYLHDALRVGDILLSSEPAGNFTLEPEPTGARHLVMVAGGVGITPLVSIAETLLHREADSRVSLLFGNRSQEEIIFRERLQSLAGEFGARLSLCHCLEEAPQGWTGLRGPLDGTRVLNALDGVPADGYYLCGPEPMMKSVADALLSAGIPAGRIHSERFAYALPTSTRIPAHDAEILFGKSGRRVRAKAGQTILEAGLAAGLDLQHSCTMGGCGACKIRRREGSVVMNEPNCLTDGEREAGFVLACCAYADSTVVVDEF